MFVDSDYESDSEEGSTDGSSSGHTGSSGASGTGVGEQSSQPPLKKLKKFEELLVKFLVNTDQPLSLVDSEIFRQLLQFLNKHVQVPCRQTVTQLINRYYNKVRVEISFELAES